jgi:hypothetical protein
MENGIRSRKCQDHFSTLFLRIFVDFLFSFNFLYLSFMKLSYFPACSHRYMYNTSYCIYGCLLADETKRFEVCWRQRKLKTKYYFRILWMNDLCCTMYNLLNLFWHSAQQKFLTRCKAHTYSSDLLIILSLTNTNYIYIYIYMVRIVLLICSYVFRRNCHIQGAHTSDPKTYISKWFNDINVYQIRRF